MTAAAATDRAVFGAFRHLWLYARPHTSQQTMPADDSDALIERVYEAAILPELWPALLDDVARRTGSLGINLFVTNTRQVSRWTASPGVVDVLGAWVKEGWQSRSERPQRMFAKRSPGWVTEDEVFTPEELERQPDYVGFFKPRGLKHAAGMGVVLPSGDLGIFDLSRLERAGPLDEQGRAFLDMLRPHFGRAALMAARLELERVRAAVGILNDIGLPGAVLAADGRALAANAMLEGLSGQVEMRARDRVGFRHGPAEALLAGALARLVAGLGVATGSSIALPASDEAPAAVAHLIPISRGARDIFASAAAFLIVTPLGRAPAPGADVLSGLFDLTVAESRVARGLLDGKTIETVAAENALSLSTVRNQLGSVMRKTGVNRQAELMLLLNGTSLPR